MKPDCPVARKADYVFQRVPHAAAAAAIKAWHYSGGSSNTSVYAFALFRGLALVGAALWLPPTKVCAQTVDREQWQRVISLSRLAIHPDEPQNAASILIGRCLEAIRKDRRWVAAVTFADSSQGHTGTIYRATNWTYVGSTKPEPRWLDADGRQVARKATHSRTAAQMSDLGYRMVGKFTKEKFTFNFSLKQSTQHNTEHKMAKTRAELLKAIAESTASGGGNYIRDSRGRLVVKRTALETGFNGDRFVIEFIVVSSAQVSVIALTGQNGQTKGSRLNIEPHAVGDSVSEVYMLGDPRKDPGFGKSKAFILALLGLNPLEVSASDIAETMDDMDRNNGARGMIIDYTTRRLVTKEKGTEITVTDFSNVPGTAPNGQQSDEEIAAMCAWMEALMAPPQAAAPVQASA